MFLFHGDSFLDNSPAVFNLAFIVIASIYFSSRLRWSIIWQIRESYSVYVRMLFGCFNCQTSSDLNYIECLYFSYIKPELLSGPTLSNVPTLSFPVTQWCYSYVIPQDLEWYLSISWPKLAYHYHVHILVLR